MNGCRSGVPVGLFAAFPGPQVDPPGAGYRRELWRDVSLIEALALPRWVF